MIDKNPSMAERQFLKDIHVIATSLNALAQLKAQEMHIMQEMATQEMSFPQPWKGTEKNVDPATVEGGQNG